MLITRGMPVDKTAGEVLRTRLRDIRLLTLDVDGVLTDGGLYFADDGRRFHKFNVKDGLGIKRVMAANVEIAIVSAGCSPAVHHRGKALGLRRIHTQIEDKLETVKEICGDLGIDLNQAAHMGDDLTDVPVMDAVGLAFSVADAVDEARNAATYITSKKGGDGAVREVCDMLVKAKAQD